MRLGKLDNDELERLVLNKFVRSRPECIAGPAVGRDCAALDLADDLTVLSCDPITSAGIGHLGTLSVHVCCNDAAAAGAEPVGLMVTLLMPPNGTTAEIERIARDLAQAAKSASVDILGGHTEFTDAVTRPVSCTTVIARMQKSSGLRGMRPGDDLVMSKWAGLEGTGIIATDFADHLSGLPAKALDVARGYSQYMSVVPESSIAMQHGATAMHDTTEGGVLGAVWELTRLYGCGAVIDENAIDVLPETRSICGALKLNPLRLIGSGSLLIACTDGKALVAALERAGIHGALIGHATNGALCDTAGKPIDPPGADEIYRLYQI